MTEPRRDSGTCRCGALGIRRWPIPKDDEISYIACESCWQEDPRQRAQTPLPSGGTEPVPDRAQTESEEDRS